MSKVDILCRLTKIWYLRPSLRIGFIIEEAYKCLKRDIGPCPPLEKMTDEEFSQALDAFEHKYLPEDTPYEDPGMDPPWAGYFGAVPDLPGTRGLTFEERLTTRKTKGEP